MIESISEPSVIPTNATGLTADGRVFFDLSANIPGAELDPGERTNRLTMNFSNPNRLYFELETTVYQSTGGVAAKPLSFAGWEESPHPDTASRLKNYPNPFNSTTQIDYELADDGEMSLVVYDILGQQVRVLARGYQAKGIHQVTWNGRDAGGIPVSSGAYFYQFVGPERAESRWMLLLK